MGNTPTETGVCHLSLSYLDIKVRNWFVYETKVTGCGIKIDTIRNISAIYLGKNEGYPPLSGPIWTLNKQEDDMSGH